MFLKGTSVLAMIMLSIAGVGSFSIAGPTVTITSPTDGAGFTSSALNITGHSSGSYGYWNQSSQADFMKGSGNDLVIGADGTVSLDRTDYDDFNDNSIDAARWQTSNVAGVSVWEKNGALEFSGTSNTGALYGGEGVAISTAFASSKITAYLASLSGTGSGYITRIGFYQDDDNMAEFFIKHEGSQYIKTEIDVSKCEDGLWYFKYLGTLTAGPHSIGLEYINGSVTAFLDGVNIGNTTVALANARCRIETSARSNGDPVTAVWDDVVLGYPRMANYTSEVFDSESTDPVLTSVGWTAKTPAGTAVSFEVRSSQDGDMAGSTPWTAVANGGVSGLPAVRQYIQYRSQLSSSDGTQTPSFKDFSLKFHKPVSRVDVSIDNKATWLPANGTESWYILLVLPEGTTQIWVRAKDVAGASAVTSVRVSLDSTPPTGSIVINDNASFTVERLVKLGLNATDRSGVSSMMVGEEPTFAQAAWKDFAGNIDFTLSDGDGPKTVYVKYKDFHGLESNVYNATIILDTLPPVGGVIIEKGAEYTRNSTVTLELEASDPIGVRSMIVGTTAEFQDAHWAKYKTETTVDLAPGNGERAVYVKFRDSGGHESSVYSDTILLDQQPPAVTVVIEGGAAYTRNANVTATLTPSENFKVASMRAGVVDAANLSLLPWVAFQASINLTLPPGDGAKTVSACLQDMAGNIGAAGSATTILDTLAPATAVGALPAISTNATIPVSWSGSDQASGVQWYDVQYRTQNGTWTDWLAHTSLTSGVFKGADLETYSFRARAQDRAGNLEEFPADAGNAILVKLQEPVVTCISPQQDSTVSGIITVNGTCRVLAGGRNVTRVEVRVDNGTWQSVDGLLTWSTKLDSRKFADGKHTLQLRTFDGSHYSKTDEVAFTIKNARPKGSAGADGTLILLSALGICIIVTLWRKREIG